MNEELAKLLRLLCQAYLDHEACKPNAHRCVIHGVCIEPTSELRLSPNRVARRRNSRVR